MLITCPECSLQISDKAYSCPHCGFPIADDKPKPVRKSSKRLKLPNGFGQITRLKQPLRKPYRVMITVGHTDTGRSKTQLLKPEAYFESYNDAYMALIEYHKNPYKEAEHMTLAQLFDEWLPLQEDKVSASTFRRYRSVFKRLAKYQSMEVKLIRPRVIQEIMSELNNQSAHIKSDVKSLLNVLFDYAVINEISDKNHARNCRIDIDTKSEQEHHISFTDEEMTVLWENISDTYVQWILIQCYTGMRPDELCKVELANINLDEGYLIAGSKTEAGMNRIIPIHPCIKDFIVRQMKISSLYGSQFLLSDHFNQHKYPYEPYKKHFYRVRDRLKLDSRHKPHDCRKFFITEAKKYQLDEYAIKRIVGHKITDLTENVYTERNISWLCDQMLLIPAPQFVHMPTQDVMNDV